MPADFGSIFAQLKPILASYADELNVKADTPKEYTLLTKSASPFHQHKGEPLYFGSVRVGKAYVSFHLMPLYMNEVLTSQVPPALKKRMQGKTCFSFKNEPAPVLLNDLRSLTAEGVRMWKNKAWL